MAKKSRRDRRTVSSNPVAPSQMPSVAPVAGVEQVKPGTTGPARVQKVQADTAKKPLDFTVEYHYVVSDLRRMGILAAVLLVGLIVMSFVL